MDIEQITSPLNQKPIDFNSSPDFDLYNGSSRTEYQRRMYINLKLATPVLKHIKEEIEIPLLEEFPEPAIPIGEESTYGFIEHSRINNFCQSPNIESKLETLNIPLTKKITSEKVFGVPNIDSALDSDDFEDLSTLASSNKPSKRDINIIYSEEQNDEKQKHILKSTKVPYSPERKLSNEDEVMLPPRAQDCELLKPSSKFTQNLNFVTKSSEASQKSQKPMTILGFLQNSIENKLQFDCMKITLKAGVKNQTILSLISGSNKASANMPCSILG